MTDQPPGNVSRETLESKTLLMNMRKAWLELVDAIERELGIKPTTAEIRQMWRSGRLSAPGNNGKTAPIDNNNHGA